jgi:hypothetical protein
MPENFLTQTELALNITALRYVVGVMPPEHEKLIVAYQILHNKLQDLFTHQGGSLKDLEP